jgi:hypothetical protein
MTTALAIIKTALLEVGGVDVTETPDADMAAFGLTKLNDLIDTWATEPTAAYNNHEVTVTLPSTTRSLTIGPGQSIDVERPIRIESAYVRLNNLDRPMEVVEKQEYDNVLIKGLGTAWPDIIWYDGGLPTGNVYVWPLASAPVELHLTVLNYVGEFASVTTSQTLAKGYRRALTLNLAVEMAPSLQLPVSADLLRRAGLAYKAIKRANSSVPQMESAGRRTSRLGQFLSGGM